MKHEYKGLVVKGDGVAGRDLNMPTANLDLTEIDLEPAVYIAYTFFEGKKYRSLVCYGASASNKFEVHLFHFDGDLLGKELDVNILEKISDLVPWESVERMRQKILHDHMQAQERFIQLEKGKK